MGLKELVGLLDKENASYDVHTLEDGVQLSYDYQEESYSTTLRIGVLSRGEEIAWTELVLTPFDPLENLVDFIRVGRLGLDPSSSMTDIMNAVPPKPGKLPIAFGVLSPFYFDSKSNQADFGLRFHEIVWGVIDDLFSNIQLQRLLIEQPRGEYGSLLSSLSFNPCEGGTDDRLVWEKTYK